MFRITAIILAMMYALLASGAPAYMHAREHEKAAQAGAAHCCNDRLCVAWLLSHRPGVPSKPEKQPSPPETCPICFQLHAPLVPLVVPVIILDRGPLVEVTADVPLVPPEHLTLRFTSCRGPPSA